MGFFKSAGNVLKNVGIGIKDTVVGLGETAFNAGKYVGKSAYTAVVDPTKFRNDCANNIKGWGKNIVDSWKHGRDTIAEGQNLMKEGLGFRGFMKAASGTIEMCTGGGLGATDAYRDYVDDRVDFVTDELGNYTAVQHDDLTWFEKQMTKSASKTAHEMNVDNEIHEALDEGDLAKAKEIDKIDRSEKVGKAISVGTKVAAVGVSAGAIVAGVIGTPETGGASLGAAIAASKGIIGAAFGVSTAVDVVSNMNEGFNMSKFDKLNLEDDISDQIATEVARLQAAGALKDENVEDYSAALHDYLLVSSYKGTNTADRDSFTALAQANHYLEPEYQETMMKQSYAGLIRSENPDLPDSHVDYLTDISIAHDKGEMSDRDYIAHTCATQMYNLQCNREQRFAYGYHFADLATGAITEEQFAANLVSDPKLSEFVGLDGSFNIPEKESLIETVSEYDAFVAAKEQSLSTEYDLSDDKQQERTDVQTNAEVSYSV